MSLLGCPIAGDVGLKLLLSPTSASVISRTACVAVGVAFPVYSTFKAIENHDEEEKEQWLMYWAVYGCFHVAEIFGDKLLFWFPYYHHAKLAFLIWLQLPVSNGARRCFRQLLEPFLLKHRNQFDSVVDGTRNELNKFVLSHQPELHLIKNAAQKLLTAARGVVSEQTTSTDHNHPTQGLDSIPCDADTFSDDEEI
ncbi:hypothetical protein KP509_06G054700 [Ceratopteris richardii]|uniref:HVA22-like protein n=1 Tax=Ceratopteris richardii TaxID=49495 RepID=A0A8T2UKF2_CERRI|nr:hypothetical protein KP509_06G054700 [Ceratopteris richardii]KAH7435209.1 hypothetical protein KP509_06G054700 [Ceratopteris richardii]KAH7435210.1 hypothetical protein KP509_06G054700 [Ceratopteris richardii]KAH7435211.1 hypothetical protein KP509_06G054700 [Ceratopteris richardii]